MNLPSDSISGTSAVQRLLDAFNRDLLSGQLQPGDRIPTEIELSEHFGVARNTVREAVKILVDRKSTRLNSSHAKTSRMPSSA